MTDNFFEKAFSQTFKTEGGYVNNPNDSGGPTKYGITLKTYRQYYPSATINTIKNLTPEQAKVFYREYFWLKNGYDKIKIECFALKVFDACVNMGEFQAHLCLQRALNCVGSKLKEDGVLGENTLKVLNFTGDPTWNFAVLCSYKSELAGFYRVLIAKKPKNKEFETGWLKRAYHG
ncbi:MAG: glycoside hydrolase family 108 protein [Alphaproteobacteria bacterium]